MVRVSSVEFILAYQPSEKIVCRQEDTRKTGVIETVRFDFCAYRVRILLEEFDELRPYGDTQVTSRHLLASAHSGDLLGNREVLFVSTVEDPANPLGELVSTEQPLRLNYLAFAMNPLRLYRVEPGALGGQQTRHYPDPMAAGFDTAVVGGDLASDLMAFMPACVVPDKKQGLLTPLTSRSAPMGGRS
jgi:hypothetical protein